MIASADATDTFVALLRGINVGRGNRVPMAGLRALLQGLGYRDVSTLLNSGNAVFRAAGTTDADAAQAISAAVAAAHGVSVPVVVISGRRLLAAVQANPVQAADASRLLVVFAGNPAELEQLQPLHDLLSASEQFHIMPAAAYLYCPEGIAESRAAAALLGRLGRRFTTRNWATVQKIAERISSLPTAS